MPISNVLALNQLLLRPYLANARCAVDATVGNGHDSAFILRHAPRLEYLFCCDIQSRAIQSSRNRLAETETHAQLYWYEMDHAAFFADFPLPIDVAVFNLGYLPGTDHKVHTHTDNTLTACTQALSCLRKGGVLSVVSYPGTPAGEREHAVLQEWARTLRQQQWHVACIDMINQIHQPPCLLFIERR